MPGKPRLNLEKLFSSNPALFCQTGNENGGLPKLIIVLAGRINRSDFGANGWKNDVGRELVLRITTHIDQVAN